VIAIPETLNQEWVATMLTKAKFSVLTVCLLLLSSVGCMVNPGDQQVFASRETPIPFSGFTINPGRRVDLYAKNATTNVWTKIDHVYSGTGPMQHFNSNWYPWNKELKVPKAYWKKSSDGSYSAVLKAISDNNELYTFQEGFYNYAQDYDNAQDLYLENKSAHGIEIVIWANN
jgi:hypothetical protein